MNIQEITAYHEFRKSVKILDPEESLNPTQVNVLLYYINSAINRMKEDDPFRIVATQPALDHMLDDLADFIGKLDGFQTKEMQMAIHDFQENLFRLMKKD